MAWLKRFITLTLVAVCPSTALAHETDQYSVPAGREFADLGEYFAGALRIALEDAVDTLNAQIRGTLRGGEPTSATERFYRPRVVADTCYHALPLWFSWVDAIEHRLKTTEQRRTFPGLITVHQPSSWIYEHWALVIDPTKLPRQVRCGTVMVNGVYFGTDKLMHFSHIGFQYHEAYRRALDGGKSESEALHAAIELGSGANPFYSEATWLGLVTTGVWSNADLAANYVGFLFFRNLTETTEIRGEAHPPLLQRDGVYWRVADRVADDDALFSRFVTDHWDEVLNPCWYPELIGKCVRQSIAERCDDTVAWYRVRRRSARSPSAFLEQAAQLQEYYGVEYGARGETSALASIATVCDDWGNDGPSESVDPDATRDAWDRTALWWAAYEGSEDDVQAALVSGGDPNRTDIDGESPLHAAARRGEVGIVKRLCVAGADVNLRARYGTTPLHLAARAGHSDVVALLLDSGANPTLVDAFGRAAHIDPEIQDNPVIVARLASGFSSRSMSAVKSSVTKPVRLAAHISSEVTMETMTLESLPESIATSSGASLASLKATTEPAMPMASGAGVQVITMEPYDADQP